ncbi:uncharacterized protein LOC129611519 [Condylostylus longicornis]|uniref:uncharacterized protein LOC129611519 n=1 Tax=Condylostylus longicornis TaxID=2530218 RepID=UPI00244E0758|nr:uncharacterized protein LOC129611519 [Condylostylus longicornis]
MDTNSEKVPCVKLNSEELKTSLVAEIHQNTKAPKLEKLSRENQQAQEKIFLLEDSTLQKLPDYAETLLNIFMQSKQRSEIELLIALIYCIALESGFAVESCLNSNDNENLHLSFFYGSTYNKIFAETYSSHFPDILPDKINQNFYKFTLLLANYPQYKCVFVAIRTGEYLVVTLTNCHSPGYSWCLSVPRYVLTRTSNNFQRLFRNLQELSMLMKNHLFGPVRNLILAQSNNLFPGLTGLPVELCCVILRNLNNTDLQSLSKTCWKLRCICVDYYVLKDKPLIKPYGSKYPQTLDNSSSAILRHCV